MKRLAWTMLGIIWLVTPVLSQQGLPDPFDQERQQLRPVPSRATPQTVVAEQARSSPVTTTTIYRDALSDNRLMGRGQLWMRGEYLLWWLSGGHLPPLVTEDLTGATSGVLGAPGTVVRFGDGPIFNDVRSGFQISTGYWFNPQQTFGIEANFFMLGDTSASFSLGSDGTRSIGRPFFDTRTGTQSAQFVSFLNTPDPITGSVTVSGTSSNLWGAGLDLRKRACGWSNCDCGGKLDFLIGYRYLNYDEELGIAENLTPIGQLIVPGSRIIVVDRFRTENEFNGLNLGIGSEIACGPWVLELTGRLGIGCNRTVVQIDGLTTITVPGDQTVQGTGGLLAQVSNIGRYDNTEVALVPEVAATVGYQVTPNLRLLAGYTFLWWTNIARVGDQIDLRVNPTFIPRPGLAPTGLPSPIFQLKQSDLWAQGLRVGFEFRY